MGLIGPSKDDIKDNVAQTLESQGLRADTDFVQSALGYILDKTPANFVAVCQGRIVPDQQHVLSVLVIAVTVSLGEDSKQAEILQRLSEVQEKLVEECP